ncbi:hypothetical protein DL770_004594 [Monosporascus sp. CRB-9-2]|nr:hypothetical protein DL770_004594 [Monosporascus sp. CRB-9-2]
MPTFTVFKGDKSGAPKKSTTTRPDALKGDQVFIRITASGVCGTENEADKTQKSADMVLGHEGVGVVEEVGPECKQCLTGRETHCPERAMYAMADLDQGSFGSHAVWKEAFLFKIPDGLSDEAAAPMQCGGATVFQALRGYNTQSTETVGIMGVGGLGHFAIQFAAKMGCRVVVLSGTESKRDEAIKLGAHEFVATRDKEELKVSHPLNRLLVTTSAQPNWDQIIPIMAPGGYIYPLTVAAGDFKIPYMGLLLNGLTVQGSLVAPRHIHKEMLEFAALHKIEPVVETFPMTEEGIKEAMERLEQGKVHFRAVLKSE